MLKMPVINDIIYLYTPLLSAKVSIPNEILYTHTCFLLGLEKIEV